MALVVSSLLVSACAETPRAGFKRDYAAKRFRNPPFDRANIYVYRLTGSWDADLLLDGVRVTTLAKWSFVVLPVRAGIHQLTARYRSRPAGAPKDHVDAELELYAGVGSNYFIEQNDSGSDVAMAVGVASGGLIGAAVGAGYRELSLDRVEPDDGKEGVRRCTLVADRPPPLPPPTP